MHFLRCVATLSCCLSGLHTITVTLAYSDSAQDDLLTESHERAALDIFNSDFKQKVAPDGTPLNSDAAATSHSYLADVAQMHPLRIWNVDDET